MEQNRFVRKLTEFLDSETDDYSLAYEISPIDDDGVVEVLTWVYGDNKEIIKEETKNSTYWKFEDNELKIEMGEDTDSWEAVADYNWTVKYFWMMVSPYLFRVK